MWPFVMGLSQKVGRASAIFRAFPDAENNKVMNLINDFLPGSQKLNANVPPGHVAYAFSNLADALNIKIRNAELWRAREVPFLMLMQLLEGVDVAALGLHAPVYQRLHEEMETRRLEDDGIGNHNDFKSDWKQATDNLEVLKYSRYAQAIWSIFDYMTDRAWSICRPKYPERETFLLSMQADMGPEDEDLPLRRQFVGTSEQNWVNPRGKGAGGVVPWVFTPSQLGERKVIKEMFSYLPTPVEAREGLGPSMEHCAAALRESFRDALERAPKPVQKVLREVMQNYDLKDYLVRIGEPLLRVLQQGATPPRGDNLTWDNFMLPAIIGLSQKIHPLRVFAPELKKIGQRKRARGDSTVAAQTFSLQSKRSRVG